MLSSYGVVASAGPEDDVGQVNLSQFLILSVLVEFQQRCFIVVVLEPSAQVELLFVLFLLGVAQGLVVWLHGVLDAAATEIGRGSVERVDAVLGLGQLDGTALVSERELRL